MKKIKILCMVLFLSFSSVSWGQNWPLFRDDALNTAKFAIIAELGYLFSQKERERDSYNDLMAVENEFQLKLNGTNTNVNITLGVSQWEVLQTNNLILQVQTKINVLKTLPPFRYPLMIRIQSELDAERVHMEQIDDDILDETVALSRVAGGAGFGKNYYMKILLRTKRIKRKVMELDYRINNLDTFRVVFHN